MAVGGSAMDPPWEVHMLLMTIRLGSMQLSGKTVKGVQEVTDDGRTMVAIHILAKESSDETSEIGIWTS